MRDAISDAPVVLVQVVAARHQHRVRAQVVAQTYQFLEDLLTRMRQMAHAIFVDEKICRGAQTLRPRPDLALQDVGWILGGTDSAAVEKAA
jgi:hypothetical protein